LFLDNKVGGNPLTVPLEGRPGSSQRRAVLVGPVWTADLVESLWTIYRPMFEEGYTLEDVAQMVQGASDESAGD